MRPRLGTRARAGRSARRRGRCEWLPARTLEGKTGGDEHVRLPPARTAPHTEAGGCRRSVPRRSRPRPSPHLLPPRAGCPQAESCPSPRSCRRSTRTTSSLTKFVTQTAPAPNATAVARSDVDRAGARILAWLDAPEQPLFEVGRPDRAGAESEPGASLPGRSLADFVRAGSIRRTSGAVAADHPDTLPSGGDRARP